MGEYPQKSGTGPIWRYTVKCKLKTFKNLDEALQTAQLLNVICSLAIGTGSVSTGSGVSCNCRMLTVKNQSRKGPQNCKIVDCINPRSTERVSLKNDEHDQII